MILDIESESVTYINKIIACACPLQRVNYISKPTEEYTLARCVKNQYGARTKMHTVSYLFFKNQSFALAENESEIKFK